MTNRFTTEQIQEKFETLPDDIRDAVASPEITDLLKRIAEKHKLRIDKTGVLIEQSALIMLGLIKSNEFVDQLTTQLEISRELAETIAVEVDGQVFSRVRDSLRQVQYKSTTDSRFEETDDYGGEPVRDSLIADIERSAQEDPIVGAAVNEAMSTGDYDPNQFTAAPETADVSQNETVLDETVQINTVVDDPVPDPYNPDPVPTPTIDSVPVPETAAPELVKDFKQKLQEKIAANKPAASNDPYRESVE